MIRRPAKIDLAAMQVSDGNQRPIKKTPEQKVLVKNNLLSDWGRKLGLLALLMSLSLTGACFQGQSSPTLITWPASDNVEYTVGFAGKEIHFSKRKSLVFELSGYICSVEFDPEVITVPYWPVIAPLTPISAFLILQRP